MQVYRVQISASGIRGEFGGEKMVCGFIKNEYILTASKDKARQKAVENVRRKLRRKNNLSLDDTANVSLSIDSVETGFSWLSAFRDEGFVFHPSDA